MRRAATTHYEAYRDLARPALALVLATIFVFVLAVAASAEAECTGMCCEYAAVDLSGGGGATLNSGAKAENSAAHLAFWSTAVPGDPATPGNSDGNIEIYHALVSASKTTTYGQNTNTVGSLLGGVNLAPAISAGGDLVAFVSDRSFSVQNRFDTFQVYVSPFGESSDAKWHVGNDFEGYSIEPAIAHDGSGATVAYSGISTLDRQEGSFSPRIFAVRFDSSGKVSGTIAVTRRDQVAGTPTLDDTGTRIAYVAADPNKPARVWFAKLDWTGHRVDGSPINLSCSSSECTDGVSYREPAMDKSGRFVAYTRESPGRTAVWRAEIDATGIVTRTLISIDDKASDDDQALAGQPSISADGRRILYTVQTGAVAELHVWDADSETTTKIFPVELPAGVLLDTATVPSITDDGSLIAFVAGQLGGNADQSSGGQRKVYLYKCKALPLADLGVEAPTDLQSVVVGGTLTLTLTYRNAGPSSAQGVVLTDTLPEGFTFLNQPDQWDSSEKDNWTLSHVGNQLIWTYKPNVPFTPHEGTVSFTITAPTTEMTGENVATIISLTPENAALPNTATTAVTVLPDFDLKLESLATDPLGITEVAAGSRIKYKIRYSNSGPSSAPSARIEYALGGAEFEEDLTPADLGWTLDDPASTPDKLVWRATHLAQGAGVLTFAVTAPAPSVESSLTSSATIYGNLNGSSSTSNELTITVTPAYDLKLDEFSSATENITAGTTMTYTLKYSNSGPSSALGVKPSANLGEMTFVAPASAANCTGAWTENASDLHAPYRDCTELAPGATLSVDFTLQAPTAPPSPPNITLTAIVAVPLPGISYDSPTNNNKRSVRLTVKPSSGAVPVPSGAGQPTTGQPADGPARVGAGILTFFRRLVAFTERQLPVPVASRTRYLFTVLPR